MAAVRLKKHVHGRTEEGKIAFRQEAGAPVVSQTGSALGDVSGELVPHDANLRDLASRVGQDLLAGPPRVENQGKTLVTPFQKKEEVVHEYLQRRSANGLVGF